MSITLHQLALFGAAFFVVALAPGPLTAALLARTVAYGFRSGAAMALGTLAGDAMWALTAIFGLALLAASYADVLIWLKYAGAALLVYLGIKLLLSARKGLAVGPAAPRDTALRAALSGFLITCGNPKAALFYVAIMPGFFDITRLTAGDVAAILGVIALVLAVVLLGYAAIAARAARVLRSPEALRRMNMTSGGLLIGAGAFVAAS